LVVWHHAPRRAAGLRIGAMVKDHDTESPIRVLLADDHNMFREGLANVLTSHGGIEVVAETTNDEGAVALVRHHTPDVVVMQAQLPLERAKETLDQMRRVSPSPKVVICTMFEDPRYVREFLKLGVSAYLVKSASVKQLIAALRVAVLDPQGKNVVVGMPRKMLEEAEVGTDGALSARELEILLLAARGLSNRQIATSLRVAEATIKRHLANTYVKIGVGSRGEAARKALSEGWITIEQITEADA
jgi:DNA-binding NarL/FixJ family response regulator